MLAKFLARQLPRSAFELPPNKFQPFQLGAPKALHRQNQPLLGVIRDCQYSPRQVESFRPKMQERLFAVPSHFPR